MRQYANVNMHIIGVAKFHKQSVCHKIEGVQLRFVQLRVALQPPVTAAWLESSMSHAGADQHGRHMDHVSFHDRTRALLDNVKLCELILHW